jgi:hypothetical protein
MSGHGGITAAGEIYGLSWATITPVGKYELSCNAWIFTTVKVFRLLIHMC